MLPPSTSKKPLICGTLSQMGSSLGKRWHCKCKFPTSHLDRFFLNEHVTTKCTLLLDRRQIVDEGSRTHH